MNAHLRPLPWLLPLAALLVVPACGGGDDEAPAPPAPPPPPSLTVGAPTTVRYMAPAQGANAESAAIHLPLTIPTTGWFQCDAHADEAGAALDAQMAIFSGGAELARDSDSGDGFDARIVRELPAGTYDVRVWEWRSRPSSIRTTCIVTTAPPPSAVALTLGMPAVANVVPGQGPGSQPELALTITTPGTYQCDASAPGRDAQLAIVQNGQILQQDSDSGEGVNARLTRELAPGVYQVRVWEWMHRDAAITVSCAPAAAPVLTGTLAMGAPSMVTVAAGEGPTGEANLALNIGASGNYRCYAHAEGADAQMSIVQNGVVLQTDSDSGEGTDAQIIRALTPGAYQVRVWEWLHRPATITVTCNPA
ncbi:MAG: hypothetical protein R3B82_05190 [Sandaracinaceae bacterium]